MNPTLAAEIEQLSRAEKLLLVESLWDSIAKDAACVEPPKWHDQLLAEDAVRYASTPSRGNSWETAKRRIVGGQP